MKSIDNVKLTSINTAEMTHEEWLEARKTGIGGSDIAAIMGLSNYATAYDVFKSKMGQNEESSEENELLKWGNILEEPIAQEFSNRTGLKIQNVNVMMRHPDKPWALANIDKAIINPEISKVVRYTKEGVLTTDTILEVKTANEFQKKEWGEEHTDEIPAHYLCQVHWYLGVTGATGCHVAVLIGGNNFRQYFVPRNEAIIEALFKAGEKFWKDHILTGIAPKPVNLDNAKDAWKTVDPNSVLDVSIESELAEKISELNEVKERIKEYRELEKELQKEIICHVQDSEVVKIDGNTVLTYKEQSRNSFDSKTFKADHPELYKQYVTVSTSRTMRLK